MIIRSTTVLGIVKDGKAALGSDGQVTMGNTVMKANAKKLRVLYNGQVIAGFAGSTSDALTLYERFNSKLEEFRGNVPRAVVELGKDWRNDKYLRRLGSDVSRSKQNECISAFGNRRCDRAGERHRSHRLRRALCARGGARLH